MQGKRCAKEEEVNGIECWRMLRNVLKNFKSSGIVCL